MPRLILVKHSLPRIEPDKPAREWHLSAEGVRRCDALADVLSAHQPHMVVSSEEPKAVETAECVAARLGLSSRIVTNLHEHERPTTGFLTRDAFQSAMERFFAQPSALVFGDETADEAHARFLKAVGGVIATHPRETAVIVAHGTVISLLVARANRLDAFALWQRLSLPSFIALSSPGLILRRVSDIVEEV